mmetsp:Transcript_3155/g.9028  ORF Transcript_3155/g.9028 Transcript_3155/m.9028 type:complete len:246 (-) Transcript_3155:138-875(-)
MITPRRRLQGSMRFAVPPPRAAPTTKATHIDLLATTVGGHGLGSGGDEGFGVLRLHEDVAEPPRVALDGTEAVAEAEAASLGLVGAAAAVRIERGDDGGLLVEKARAEAFLSGAFHAATHESGLIEPDLRVAFVAATVRREHKRVAVEVRDVSVIRRGVAAGLHDAVADSDIVFDGVLAHVDVRALLAGTATLGKAADQAFLTAAEVRHIGVGGDLDACWVLEGGGALLRKGANRHLGFSGGLGG